MVFRFLFFFLIFVTTDLFLRSDQGSKNYPREISLEKVVEECFYEINEVGWLLYFFFSHYFFEHLVLSKRECHLLLLVLDKIDKVSLFVKQSLVSNSLSCEIRFLSDLVGELKWIKKKVVLLAKKKKLPGKKKIFFQKRYTQEGEKNSINKKKIGVLRDFFLISLVDSFTLMGKIFAQVIRKGYERLSSLQRAYLVSDFCWVLEESEKVFFEVYYYNRKELEKKSNVLSLIKKNIQSINKEVLYG
jgi:hypothetical protein